MSVDRPGSCGTGKRFVVVTLGGPFVTRGDPDDAPFTYSSRRSWCMLVAPTLWAPPGGIGLGPEAGLRGRGALTATFVDDSSEGR